MECGRSCYLNRPIEDMGESIAFLNSVYNSLKAGQLSGEEKVIALDKVFHLLNNTVPMELGDLTWTVKTLDMEKDSHILHAAFNALNEMQIALQMIRSVVSKEMDFQKAALIMEEIHTLSGGHFAEATICTHEKVAKLMNSMVLPTMGEMEGEDHIATSEADLMLSRDVKPASSTPQYVSFFTYAKNNLVFTPGRYYNPIPCSVYSYQLNCIANDPERAMDILGMLKGEQMSTVPKEIFLDGGSIPDKHGEFVMVPSVFAADLARMKEFNINGTTYYDKAEYHKEGAYNPNECAREIYRLLGKVGGERFMQICQQGTMAHFLEKIIFPLVMGGAWEKLLPGKFLVPSQDSGFMVDLKVDYEKNLLLCSKKILMKLHVEEEETTFTAHFVAKTDISISLDELTRPDLMDNENPVPSLQVSDTISTLVINNPAEAKELLEKF